MKSRAELLAEIEENRIKNKRLNDNVEAISIDESETGLGYDPYDHPGRSKELPDGADITLRRRAILRRKRRR